LSTEIIEITYTVVDENGCSNTSTQFFEFDVLPSTEGTTIEAINYLTHYTKKGLIINFTKALSEKTIIQVFNMNGQSVYKQLINPSVSRSIQLELFDLAAGLYLVQVSNNTFNKTKPFIVKE